MQIVIDYPPMYGEIARTFNLKLGQGVIFCWGAKIYNPDDINISRELVRHESIHGFRQGVLEESVKNWWERYLVDADFRLREELPAHKAEYEEFCRTHKDRNKQARFLHGVADRLASPLYGSLMTSKQARHEIMTYRG